MIRDWDDEDITNLLDRIDNLDNITFNLFCAIFHIPRSDASLIIKDLEHFKFLTKIEDRYHVEHGNIILFRKYKTLDYMTLYKSETACKKFGKMGIHLEIGSDDE